MKFLLLFKSLLLTFIKSSKRLSFLSVIISVAAMLSFLSVYSFVMTSFSYDSRWDKYVYTLAYDDKGKMKEDITKLNTLPSVAELTVVDGTISYTYSDAKYVCVDRLVVRQPEGNESFSLLINKNYSVYDGRDFTEEEVFNADKYKNEIIVSRDSGLSLGDAISIVRDKENIDVKVIGIAESFVLPASFFKKYGADIRVTNKGDILYKTTPSRYSVIFDRELNEKESKLLKDTFPSSSYNMPNKDQGAPIVQNAVVIAIGVIFCIFTALQLYSIFLYIAKKAEYNISIFKITGGKSKTVLFATLLVIMCYLAISFFITYLLLPLFAELVSDFRINYFPQITDLTVAFIIYSVVVIISVLPGLSRAIKKPLSKAGENI